MGIQSTDWSNAQELLVRLVQVLAPLAEEGRGEGASSLARRLFVPPDTAENIPFPTRLLKVLHQAQSQMGQWVGETIHVTPQVPQKALHERATELVVQVRGAIQALSEHPKPPPFRDVMRKLKPLIDDLIETVGKTDMHSSDDWAPPQRSAVPIPAREHPIINKRVPFPFQEADARTVSPRVPENGAPKIHRPSVPVTEPMQKTRPTVPVTDPIQRIHPIQPESPPAPTPPAALTPSHGAKPAEKREPSPAPLNLERISLPAGPYFHAGGLPVPGKAKKKKKRDPREREEDEKSD